MRGERLRRIGPELHFMLPGGDEEEIFPRRGKGLPIHPDGRGLRRQSENDRIRRVDQVAVLRGLIRGFACERKGKKPEVLRIDARLRVDRQARRPEGGEADNLKTLGSRLNERGIRRHLLRTAETQDVQVEQQLRPVTQPPCVLFSNANVALGVRGPEAFRIFHLQQESILPLKGGDALHIHPDLLAQLRRVVAVHRRDNDLESGLPRSGFCEDRQQPVVDPFESPDAVLGHLRHRVGVDLPVVRRRAVEQIMEREPVRSAELRLCGAVHWREELWVEKSAPCFEVELGQVHPVPVVRMQEAAVRLHQRVETAGIRHRHRIPPRRADILSPHVLFPPLRMLRPEFLTHLRRFEPRIDENAVAMRETEKAVVVVRVLRVLMPAGDVNDPDSLPDPLLHERFRADVASEAGIEIDLDVIPPENRSEPEVGTDVLQEEGIAACSLLGMRIEPGAEIEEFSLFPRLPDHQGRFGRLVDGKDLLHLIRVELRGQFGVAPPNPLIGKDTIADTVHADFRRAVLDAEIFRKVILSVGDEIPTTLHIAVEEFEIFLAEGIDECIWDDHQVVRAQIERVPDEKGVEMEIDASQRGSEGGLVVESRAACEVVPEDHRTGFIPGFLFSHDLTEETFGPAEEPCHHSLLPLAEFRRFRPVPFSRTALHLPVHRTAHPIFTQLRLPDLTVPREPRLGEILIGKGEGKRLLSRQDDPVLRLHTERKIAHIHVRVAERLDAVHQLLQEPGIEKCVEEIGGESVTHGQIGLRVLQKRTNRCPALFDIGVERDVAEVLRQVPLSEQVLLDDVGKELAVLEILDGEALLHHGVKVLTDRLVETE